MQGVFLKNLLVLIFLPVLVQSQMVSKQVIIANGGAYSDPNDFVTIGAFNPETQLTANLATIFTQSVQGMMVHDGFAYVAAQDSLVKIDLGTGQISDAIGLPGVNKFGVYQDRLIVTRQYPVTSGYVQLRKLSDLSFVKTIDEVSDEAWDVIVVGDSAYISVTGGWAATVGKLAVLDMKSEVFKREMNLGMAAVGIGPVFKDGNNLCFVCKTPYMGNSGAIVKYDFNNATFTISTFLHVIGKAAGLINGQLYLMLDGNIGSIDVENMAVSDASLINDSYADLDITACALDVVNEQIYVNFSYWIAPPGIGKIYDLNGNETGQYEVGISAEDLAIDYRDITGYPNISGENHDISIYPNPCRSKLFLETEKGSISAISIFNLSGQEVISLDNVANQSFCLKTDFLKRGTFLIKAVVDQKIFTGKFIKE